MQISAYFQANIFLLTSLGITLSKSVGRLQESFLAIALKMLRFL